MITLQVLSKERIIVKEIEHFVASAGDYIHIDDFDMQHHISGIIMKIDHEYGPSGELEIFIEVE